MRVRLALFALCAMSLPAAAQTLGLPDRGVFADLDDDIELAPLAVGPATRVIVDDAHGLLLVYEGDHPVSAFPLAAKGVPLALGSGPVEVRASDLSALAPLTRVPSRVLAAGERPPGGDSDGDGLPDALDILLGAKKVAANGASYIEGYVKIEFPGGDVPRDMGVCTDVVVRAVRNAGIDLQKDLYDDIGRAPKSYKMVKRRNPHIDHRRVRTLAPYFARRWAAHGVDPADKNDPFLPGDVVFMDTMPSRPGPDHIGVISDVRGPSGLPLVVNNWTVGYRESEMDLLGFVPVTARYRVATVPRPAARGAGRTAR
jgi:hypothetical protein